MKVNLHLMSELGHMAETNKSAGTVKEALDKVLPWLDKLPDRVEGVSVMDWTSLTITIKR